MHIPELYVEDPIERTVIKYQYGVQLTYTDGRVTRYARESRESAERMVINHRAMMRAQPEWLVEKAELAVRTVTVVLGDWTVDEEGES